MNKSHKSYRAHNKENINEVECEMKDLQSKYCEMSRYFESRIQKQLQQKATEHLSYLSQISSNIPVMSHVLASNHSHMQDNKLCDTPSAWEENHLHQHRRHTSKITERRKFRGFSFWAKRNSLKGEQPQNNTTGMLPRVDHRRNHPPNVAEMQSTVYNEQPLIESNVDTTLITIKRDERNRCESNFDNNRCESKSSLSVLKQKPSYSNLQTINSRKQSINYDNLSSHSNGIQSLKQQILTNLNRQTIINRSGQFIQCQLRQQQSLKRPKSSYGLLKPRLPGVKIQNHIKLSALVEECQNNVMNLPFKPSSQSYALPRKITRGFKLNQQLRSISRVTAHDETIDRSQTRLSKPIYTRIQDRQLRVMRRTTIHKQA